MSWKLLACGFVAGACAGTLLLLGPRDGEKSDGRHADCVASSLTTPEQDDRSADIRTVDQVENLAEERLQLEKQLEEEKLRLEVERLRREIADLKRTSVSVESDVDPASQRSRRDSHPGPAALSNESLASGTSGQLTLHYWNAMNAIILKEGAMRSAPAGGITALNAAGFLDARIQSAAYAVRAIRGLSTDGVDPRVIDLSDQLVGWYQSGGEVAMAGKKLLTGASVQERQGTAGKQYQAAERHHSENVTAINAAGEQIRQEMMQTYGLSFAPLN